MPYEYSIDAVHRLVRVRMWGEVTRDEVMTTTAQMAADPLLRPEFPELIDLREVTSVRTFSAEDVRAIASAPLDPVARRAFVTPDLLTSGLARMFGTLRNLKKTPDQVEVFRSLEEAETWVLLHSG